MTKAKRLPESPLPQRLCVSCRELRPRCGMIRLTASVDRQFAVDRQPALQGRSAYVCRDPVCLSMAIKAKKFQRSLKRAIPDAILEILSNELKELKECRDSDPTKNQGT